MRAVYKKKREDRMKTRLIVLVISLIFISACSAFKSEGDKAYDGFSPDITPPVLGGANTQLEGIYVGTKVLDKNDCEKLDVETGTSEDLKIDVLQNDTLVSIAFDNDVELSGTLSESNEAAFVKRDILFSEIYYLAFSDDGAISGTCEYAESGAFEDQIGEPCAIYSIELAK